MSRLVAEVVIINGPPGVGKTTVSAILAKGRCAS